MFIAVHAGAGLHAKHRDGALRKSMIDACHKGGACKSSLDAVVAAISAMEDDENTNAALGAALSDDGIVECDVRELVLLR